MIKQLDVLTTEELEQTQAETVCSIKIMLGKNIYI